MSLDANELVRIIKKAAVDAVHASDPTAIKIGEVISINPLKIKINQKMTLGKSHLILTDNVRDFSVKMTVENDTNNAIPESIMCKVHRGLNSGEKVILLRCDGGQKFIVLNRLEGLCSE